MKKRNGLIKTSLACALIFGGVGLLAGCGKEDPKVTINDIYVTGDYAETTKEFVIGSDVSLAGATVEVSFSDGSKQTVTITDEMWKKSDYDFTTLGEKTITVKFKVNGEEKSEPITIKIVNPASVQEVIDGISTLLTSYSPQAYAESEAEIVRNSYSALSDADKALVTNYSEFFNAYKIIKKDVVNTYVELSYYSQDNQTTITGYITEANNTIDSATDFATIESAVSNAKTQIDAIPTEEEITLENAKAAALTQFDYFVEMVFSDSSLYTPQNWALVQEKISQFEEKVNNITDVWNIPNINESNEDIVEMVLIDTIASAQYKELLTDLPDVSEVTLEDFDKIESVVEAYEALENDWDKERLSLIYDEIEELYNTVLPLYIDDYKEKALIELNNYVDLDDYYQQQREYIEEQIQYVASNFEYIENNNKSVISYIDSYIEEAKRDIDWIAPKKIVDIVNKINNLPSSSDVTSLNKLIMKIDGYYDDVVAEIENDEAEIDNVTYTIDLVNGKVYLESTEVATITNNEFLLSDETYRIIDVSAEVDSIFNLVGQLSQEDKDKYNINLQNVNDIQRCLDNLETLKEELTLLETYKDLSKYTEEGQNEIKSIIDSVETELSSYVGSSVEEFAEFINDRIAIAKSRMDFVKDAVSVAKSNIAWQLENYVDYYDYYVNEQDIIKEIIRNARLEASQKTTVEEINAVIEEAKAVIDEVDTKKIVFAEAKEEAIQKLYDYINVDDYLDLETKEDLNATGENLPNITKAYQSERELINNCSDIYNFDEIESCLSSAKESIDEVKRTYEMNITEFDSKITETADKFVNSQDIDDYYVAVAELRHNSRWVYYASGHSPYISTKDGFVQADDVVVKQTKHKTFNIGNEIYVIYEDVIKCNGVSYSISDNKVTINDVEYTISEDGLTYGDSQTIDYNAEEKTVKRLYVSVAYFFKAHSDINIKVYSGPNNYEDTYTIKVTDSMVESEFGLNYHQGTNTGSGFGAGVSYDNDEDGGATLTSYNKNASYEFNYCKSGNVCYVGNVLAEVLQHENSETYYYFGKLEGIEDSRISIKALGKGAKDEITTKTTDNYSRTVKVYEGNRTSKYYEFELKYVEKVDLTVLKTYYKNLINSYDKYDSQYEAVVSQLKFEYSNKIENATSEEEIRNAYEALTHPEANVGTIEGDYLDISYAVNFKIEDNKVKFIYTGDEVGRRENNRITIDEITFTLGDETTINEKTGKGVYINDNLIGIYDDVNKYLYLHAYDTNNFEPIFSTSHELNYSVSGDGTTITVPSQEYIVSVDGETVFISSKLGFKEQVDQYLQTINVDREAIDNSVKTFMDNLANNNESLDKYVELGEIKVDTTKVQVDTDDVLIDGEYISRKKYLFYTTDCNKLGGDISGDWVYKIYNNKLYMHVGLYLEYAKNGFVIEVANTKFVLEALDSSTDVTGVNTYKEEYINSSAELSDTNVVDITSEAYDSTYGIKFDNLTQKESGYYAYAVITNEGEITYILLEDLNNAEFKIGTNREWTYGDHYLSNSAYEETLNINLYLVGKGNDIERSSASFTVNYNYVATEKYGLLGVTLPKTKYQKGETLDLSGLKVALNDVELTEDQYTIKYAVVGDSTNFVTLEEFNEAISSSYYGYNYVVIESKYKTTSNDYISRAIRIETEIQAPTLVVNETNITGLEIDRYYGRRDVSYIYEIDENTKTVTIDFLNQLSDKFVIFSSYTGHRLPIELPITLDLTKHKREFDFEIYELDEFGEYSESSLLNGILHLYEDSAVTGISLNDTELRRNDEHSYYGQVNIGNTTNVLDIDVESGYTYKLFLEDGRLADKNDIKLNLGYSNSYILKVYDSSNKFVEEIAINFEVSGEVYDDISNNLKVNGEVFNLNSPRVELYIEDVGPIDEVTFTGMNDINGLTSFKLIDYKGNNLLDSNYKFSMQNMPILAATLEIVIDGNTYYSDVIFTNFEYQYISTLNEVRVAYDGIELTAREVNNVYVEVEVPKGTIDYSKFEIIVNDYTPYDNPVIERIGETNIFKITYDEYRETPVTSYLILKEGDNTLNNDATIMIGAVNSDVLVDDLKEDIKYDLVKENQITVTQTIIDSTSEYYDETVTNYYVANDIKVNQNDCLYILNNDKYQIKEVNGEGFIYYEQWYDVYRFYDNMAEDDNYLVIDVISGDKTVKNRYIIEFERNQE